MDRCSGFLERHMLNASAIDEEKVLSEVREGAGKLAARING